MSSTTHASVVFGVPPRIADQAKADRGAQGHAHALAYDDWRLGAPPRPRVNVGVYTVLLMVILGLLTAVPAAPWATPQA